jgi:hypothetical protein
MSGFANFDPIELIRRLVEQEVDFVIIGGMAATIHGGALPTLDLDIVFTTPKLAELIELRKLIAQEPPHLEES